MAPDAGMGFVDEGMVTGGGPIGAVSTPAGPGTVGSPRPTFGDWGAVERSVRPILAREARPRCGRPEMVRAVEAFLAVTSLVLGASHVARPADWVEVFGRLHRAGRPGAFANGAMS